MLCNIDYYTIASIGKNLLKKYGFLYLTKSSDGYQTNARSTNSDKTTYTEWVYCIYKFRDLAGMEGKKEKEDTMPIF